MLIHFVEFQPSPSLDSTPCKDYGDVVNQTCLAELLERLFVVWDVHHDEEDSEVVLALQATDAIVNVLRVQAMVFERQEEGAGCSA